MTFRTIMVQLDIDVTAMPRLAFARELAGKFDAALIGFAAANPQVIIPGDIDGRASIEVMRYETEAIEARLAVLKSEFEGLVKDDPRASWHGLIGNPTQLLSLHSRAADLVVTGPRQEGVPATQLRTLDPGTLVLSAGRPVLLASEGLAPVKADSVLVAWKDTREARRAVADAMPFLLAARDVLVVTVEEAEVAPARQSMADVVQYLARHGVKARSEVMGASGSDAAEALARAARGIGADLLVSGGYGHSRIREWAFGGVTRTLLRDAALNRFMSN